MQLIILRCIIFLLLQQFSIFIQLFHSVFKSIIIIPLHHFFALIIKSNSDNTRVSHFSHLFTHKFFLLLLILKFWIQLYLMQLHINLVINQVLSYVRVLLKLIFYYLQYFIRILCRYIICFDVYISLYNYLHLNFMGFSIILYLRTNLSIFDNFICTIKLYQLFNPYYVFIIFFINLYARYNVRMK